MVVVSAIFGVLIIAEEVLRLVVGARLDAQAWIGRGDLTLKFLFLRSLLHDIDQDTL